ncbi:MAG: dihydroorotate dehydrogenase electron transfer subunit [Candidatus Peribacteraceae bacterium]|nr:dihydroorotate dehydrogenase electron transfer subunit [Candidatus Peribacteraceae bacterium]
MKIPLQTRLPKTYPVATVRRETTMVQTFTFAVSLGAKPGQFVMLWLPGVDEIPMSIALDDGKHLQVTFFAVGDMTQKLAALKKGDLVGLRGPFGTHYEWKPKQRIALVAGGYGAAPMFFAAKEAAKDGCTLDVFLGARSKEHLLYQKEFARLPRTTVHVATDDGSEGFKGTNVALLKQVLATKKHSAKKPAFHQIFACGPERMLVAVSDLSFHEQIPSQLSLERYMKCGFGLCGNCVVDPLGIRLCTDGPVVRNDLCRKIMEFGKCHRDALGRKHAF